MNIFCEPHVTAVYTEEHMVKSDFYLRLIEWDTPLTVESLSFSLYAGRDLQYQRSYDQLQVQQKLRYAAAELNRYRASSMYRILGQERVLPQAVMHEYFSVYTFQPVDRCVIRAAGRGFSMEREVAVSGYASPNRYFFPMKGTFLVSDTYASINSHRWCRNSEFAMDIGSFSADLAVQNIWGAAVYAACGGQVAEVFDGLEDSGENTAFDQIEEQYGEHARIDGNHVLLRHSGGEYTLYSHLLKGSVSVRVGDLVQPLTPIGRVGSSGSSRIPHLHFHGMRDGIGGRGIPVQFENIVSFLGAPCSLNEPTNIVVTQEPQSAIQ